MEPARSAIPFTDPGELPTVQGWNPPASPALEAELPRRQLGHYRLLEALGAGGFGAVWRAEDTILLREVAIKLLPAHLAADPEAVRRLQAEARTVAALHHPGIVTLHALEEDQGSLFLVMELVRGRTLAALQAPLPMPEVLDLGAQIAEALEAAHALGVVHRDLNPRNLMLAEDGRVKVLDFGLALRRAAAPAEPAEDAGPAGTFPYMAPEQVRGEPVDARSDVFSFGTVLFELATGARPFRGGDLPSLLKAIVAAEPELPERLPAAFAAFLRRCLAKAPADRFADGAALRRALDGLRSPGRRGSSEGPSLAVLPFTDLSPDEDEGHLCEGIAEEILAALARIEGLRVVSRTSSFLYRGSRLDGREIGRRLGAGALLTGSFRRDGGRIRVAAELTEMETGLALWSDVREAERTGIIQVPQEIADRCAAALRLRPGPSAPRRASADPEAYEDYLRGRQFYFRYNRHGMRFAMQMFRQALDRDPGYAAAWAGLANCAAFLFIYADRSEANRQLAESASRRALELDPGLAEAHASRGVALSAAGAVAAADGAFERALAEDPGLYEASYLYARHCFASDRLERARDLFERAAEIYPEDCQARLLVAQVHASLGHPEEAAAARLRGLALAEERLRRSPDDVRTRYLGANALVALGERERGLAWARSARALDPDDPMLLYNLGCIHALAGEPGAALECLEAAVDAGLSQKGWFLHDGDLDPLRGESRFQALLASLD